MNKTEWLSLRLRSETIYSLVSELDRKDHPGWEYQLLSELELEVISMKTMTSLLRSQVASSPIDLIIDPEGRT